MSEKEHMGGKHMEDGKMYIGGGKLTRDGKHTVQWLGDNAQNTQMI